MKKLKLAAMALALTIMAACANTNVAPSISGEWLATEIYGHTLPGTLNEPLLNINDTIEQALGQFVGQTGANDLSGEFIKKQDTLIFLQGAVTLMEADPVSTDVESHYLQAIGEIRTYAVEGDNLLMKNEEGKIILAFKKK